MESEKVKEIKGMENSYTKKLKELILENPNLPLVIFAGDERCFDYWYTKVDINSVKIEEITLYKNEVWLNKQDLEDKLSDDLCDEYEHLSDEEYYKMIEQKVEETEFIKCICIFCG